MYVLGKNIEWYMKNVEWYMKNIECTSIDKYLNELSLYSMRTCGTSMDQCLNQQ